MTLAERAASAKPEETAGLLEELRIAANQITPPYWHTMRGINTPESLLAAAMMLAGNDPHEYLRDAVWQVAKDLNLHIRIAKPEDNYTGRLALALIAAVAQSKGL